MTQWRGGGSNPKKDIILGLGFLLDDPSIYEVPINHYSSLISATWIGLYYCWNYPAITLFTTPTLSEHLNRAVWECGT